MRRYVTVNLRKYYKYILYFIFYFGLESLYQNGVNW